MALILEGARWVNWRWALVDKDFNRVTDFTSFTLVIISLYLLSQDSIYGLMTLLKWLPIVFFLLITTQIYSTQGSIKLSSLFLSLRRYEAQGKTDSHTRIDLSYPYMLMCLLSASTSRAAWFFTGMCWLVTWGLWVTRPRHHHVVVWGVVWMLTIAVAYLSQQGLFRLQSEIEEFILGMLWQDRDTYRQSTAIGDIGKLKQSDRIILRVEAPVPMRLRQASYNSYFQTTWRAKSAHFTPITASQEGTWVFTPWALPPSTLQAHSAIVKIAAYLPRGNGILTLPHGTYQVSHLIVPIVQQNPFGAVKVEQGPGLIRYQADFSQDTPLDSPPTQLDQDLPAAEKKYIINLSNELGLPQQRPQEVLLTLARFFKQHFHYSLQLTTSTDIQPLEYFLYHSRAGHCEYFATATVLLLRAAGIPSRYAAGYMVEEFSELEKAYVVRKRHAHAWALAYIEGRWVEVDTTPSGWLDLEEEQTAWWQPLYDLGSWLTYQFFQWRWRESAGTSDWLIWLIPPLGLILIWRLYSRQKIARSRPAVAAVDNQTLNPGADSPFYQIIAQLQTAGYVRLPGETITTWVKRIQAPLWSPAHLQTLLGLHQRYRFDPQGITPPEQESFSKQVETWLQNFNELTKKSLLI
ncbi:transglutaminase-like enzyme, predicted cysteine protease [Thioploca ingrica]|uniref:Transglutaminase-like enzyme, predicted cysteine protease n=1 Tax=Thioploca ingrica TaxID=40754 RepID=A0A090BUK5_9GAMM|nr:transglutaminase-like enzyme, predicted cysteine protease [Thioploca ingrica]